MRNFVPLVAALPLLAALGACGPTVNYHPTTVPDPTAPLVNLLVTRYGLPNLEVQGQATPSPRLRGDFGNPVPASRLNFSILATATDSQSGIRSTKLYMMRSVCYINSNGTVSEAYYGSVLRKEASYPDQSHAPIQASLGETGVYDNSHAQDTTAVNLLAWQNAEQLRRVGVGVSTKWSMEATNFANATTYSDVIYVSTGDISCVRSS